MGGDEQVAAEQIALADALGRVLHVTEVAVAGGMESMSFVPMIGHHFEPGDAIAAEWPQVFLSMGLTAEQVARRFGVELEYEEASPEQERKRQRDERPEEREAGSPPL